MLIRLKKEHLDWFLEAKKSGAAQKPGQYTDAVVRLFELIYVEGKSRAEATQEFNWSPQFSYKKCQELEKLIRKKCEEHNLTMTTIFHDVEDEESVKKLDQIIQERKEKK